MNHKLLRLSKVLFGMGLKKEASDLESLSEGSDLAGEPAGKTEFSGILKLMPANPPTKIRDSVLDHINRDRVKDEKLSPISDDRLHITLLHQSVLSPFAKEIKKKPIPPYTGSITYGDTCSIKRGDKESIFVVIKEQGELKEYVKEVLRSLGLSEGLMEESRIYHISLGNKTGTTDQSVGHSESNRMTIKESTPINMAIEDSTPI
jgi:hypothetical protein